MSQEMYETAYTFFRQVRVAETSIISMHQPEVLDIPLMAEGPWEPPPDIPVQYTSQLVPCLLRECCGETDTHHKQLAHNFAAIDYDAKTIKKTTSSDS